MLEGSLLTAILLCWLFLRAARRDEDRQQLLDLAADHGIDLDQARAARAANAGEHDRLRDRLLRDRPGGGN